MKKILLGLFLVLLIYAIGSCTPYPEEPEETVPGEIQFLEIGKKGSIPSEYGRFVAVTSSDTHPGWAQLWFEKEDKTIVMVAVNYQEGTMRDKVANIPRP